MADSIDSPRCPDSRFPRGYAAVYCSRNSLQYPWYLLQSPPVRYFLASLLTTVLSTKPGQNAGILLLLMDGSIMLYHKKSIARDVL